MISPIFARIFYITVDKHTIIALQGSPQILFLVEYTFPQNFIDRVNESNVFVIFGDGIGFKARNFVKDQFDPKRIHDLKTSGAFVYEY